MMKGNNDSDQRNNGDQKRAREASLSGGGESLRFLCAEQNALSQNLGHLIIYESLSFFSKSSNKRRTVLWVCWGGVRLSPTHPMTTN